MRIPAALRRTNWTPLSYVNQLTVERTPGFPGEIMRITYWSHPGSNQIQSLIPVITPSLGKVQVDQRFGFLFKQSFPPSEKDLTISWQIHARNYATEPESVVFGKLLEDFRMSQV